MNYVVNMLAKPQKVTTTQTSEDNVDKAMELYIKNSFVSLTSIKKNNPEYECLLFINFEMPKIFINQFKKQKIKLVYLEFGRHLISDCYNWSIVQYRYDVLEYMISYMKDNDEMLMLDTDTICVNNLDNLFIEAKYNLLLFDVQHDCKQRDRKNIIDNYYKIYGDENKYLIHYGGEFIAGNKENIIKLYNECLVVMKDAKNCKDYLENWNDEHITSIAVHRILRDVVSGANAYLFRYWTDYIFYLVSTNYKNNPVYIYHIPNEKMVGFIWLYEYLIKNNDLPSKKTLWKLFGFTSAKRKLNFYTIRYYIIRGKTKIMKKVKSKNLWIAL